MSPSPDPPFDAQPQGISLDELTEAFAQVMGSEPRRAEQSPAVENAAPQDAAIAVATAESAAEARGRMSCPRRTILPDQSANDLRGDAVCGQSGQSAAYAGRAAELMRDVEPNDIPSLVDELNKHYAARAPVPDRRRGRRLSDDALPRVPLLRSRLYGRIREARLSQAAIDVLALVAYQQRSAARRSAGCGASPAATS